MSESITSAAKQLRNAFGEFATGVTVITTRGADGGDYGLTANSFTSVSLEPPLLLWCLDNHSDCYDAFDSAGHFAVHVLTEDQLDLSNLFAKKGADKFSGLDLERGPGDIPLIKEFAARFVCQSTRSYTEGDHVIHLGQVLDFSVNNGSPLLFHRGQYAFRGHNT